MSEVTVTISEDAFQALKDIAADRKIELEDALMEALASERVIARELKNGSRILIEKRDKSLLELV